MANVLLVSPSNETIRAETQNWSSPHLGIWRIAGWLEKHGYPTTVWDTILDEEPPTPPQDGWDIMGFSIVHDTLPDDLRLIRHMKRQYPDATIMVGGPESSTNYEQIFENAPVDVAVVGEGEHAMLDLVRNTRDPTGRSIRGGIQRQVNSFGLGEFTEWNFAMPFEKMRHREHWAITKALRRKVTEKELHCVRLNTSTYCDRACPFCSVTHIHKMACGRVMKPITITGYATKELVRKVMRALPEVRSIYFNDDSFFTTFEKPETFFDNPPPLEYHIQARIDEVDRHLLRHMAQGGCRRISYGVENASNRVLKDLGKRITIEQADKVIEMTLEEKIAPIILLMLFCPSATMEDMRVNYEKMKWWESKRITISAMSYVRAYRGTGYFNQQLHEILWERKGGIKRPVAVLPDDLDVRAMWFTFEERLAQEEARLTDHWKGRVSSLMIKVLGECLKERGVI